MTEKIRGQLQENQTLAEYTSWRVGGPAKRIFHPADLKDLQVYLQSVSADEPLLWLGLGSNTLIRDQGFKGTVIITQPSLGTIEMLSPTRIKAQAGVACAKLARFSAREESKGLEFLAGVPGTVGGALRMNAGCFNGETWDHVTKVELINRQGIITEVMASEFSTGYRHVELSPEHWFISGEFELAAGNKENSLAMIRELLDRRAATQPTNEYNCGSVFRNPKGDYAARLIESCGLKGYRHGGASVSQKHANFIINDKNATAKDIEELITIVQEKVLKEFGIELIREVHIVG